MDVNNVCRFCLCQSRTLVEIFDSDSGVGSFLEKMQPIIQFTAVYETDNWPNKVCKKCSNKLESLWEFIDIVTTSQATLINEFGEAKIKAIQKYDEDETDAIVRELEENFFDDPVVKDDSDGDDQEFVDIKMEESESEKPKRSYSKSINGASIDDTISSFMKLSCSLCLLDNFKNFCELNSHFVAEHNTTGYAKCCGVKFLRRHKLYEHVMFHLNPSAFRCEICGKVSKSTDKLKDHLKSHVPYEERQFDCEKCGKKLASKQKLKAHMLTHVPEEEKNFQCPDCNKKFANKSMLNTHIRSAHEKIRKFVCEVCAKPFPSMLAMKSHQAVQHGINQQRVKCDHCGKIYSNEGTLKAHLKRINDVNTYQCENCNHVAPNKIALKAHFRNQHALYTILHGCSVCGKSFKKKKNLTEHMAGHTGQKLYKCLFCSKEFNSNANKYSHQKKSHPNEWEELNRKKHLGADLT